MNELKDDPMNRRPDIKLAQNRLNWEALRTINDGLGSAWLSAYTTLDMGAMGTLSHDSIGGGLEGTAANDDILPTAYEEADHGVDKGAVHISNKNGSSGVLSYTNTRAGIKFSTQYSDFSG